MESHNIEFRTAVKDTERCLIHKAACELVEEGDTTISKYVSVFKTNEFEESQGHNILGIRWRLKKQLGLYCIETINTNYRSLPWKGVVQQHEIVTYLNKLGSYEGFLHTDHKPVGGPRYHGNPIKGWQDWVKVKFENSLFMCQILIFLEVTHINDDNTSSLQVGKYALVHFVNQDVFTDTPNNLLYGKEYPGFRIDENCELVRGWAQKTKLIRSSVIPANSENL